MGYQSKIFQCPAGAIPGFLHPEYLKNLFHPTFLEDFRLSLHLLIRVRCFHHFQDYLSFRPRRFRSHKLSTYFSPLLSENFETPLV